MTTNVPKGAGRPAATARRSKHAQNTPLPPKPGQVAEAKAPVPGTQGFRDAQIAAGMERKRAARRAVDAQATSLASLTVAQLRQVAQERGLSTTTKLTKKSELIAALEKAAEPAQVTEEKPQPTTEPPPSGTKSEAKAAMLATEGERQGWAAEQKTEGEHTTLTLSREGEAISIEWVGGVFIDSCTYSCPGRSPIKLRNASAARKQMAVPPQEAAEKAQKVTSHKVSRAPHPGARTRILSLPFDPDLATDEEVCTAVQGRRVTWTNSLSGEQESTRVPDRAQVTMREDDSGRSINFTDASGYRAVRVASLISVR